MDVSLELVTLFTFIFLWLTCVFEALDGLSGGRILRIETKDAKLAAKLETWKENEDIYRAVLKLLLFALASGIGAYAYRAVQSFNSAFAEKWGILVIAAALLILVYFCELVARFILFHADIFILRTTIPLLSFLGKTLFFPFTKTLDLASQAADDMQKSGDTEEKVSVEDEILSYVDSYNEDTDTDLEEGEKQMIRGILEIGDMSVREIMTPRVDLISLAATETVETARKLFIHSGHSRIPVYGRSIDEIRGILFAKDFLDTGALAGKSLLQLAHKPIFIPESKEVVELLEEIKRSHNHFAVIIDEYGGTSGIVTFEDIIEEIVGEVQDEYDTEDDRGKPHLMPDGTITMEARTPLADVNEITESEIPEVEDADTIGGYICSKLGRIPEEGEKFPLTPHLRALITQADRRKIKLLRLEFTETPDDDE